MFILRTLLYNLVPSAFPSKNGWGGKMAFSRPTHFLREKPWGRGWLLYACDVRTSIIFVLYMKLHSTVQRFFLTMKKDHKPETIVFFENIWHFLISVL